MKLGSDKQGWNSAKYIVSENKFSHFIFSSAITNVRFVESRQCCHERRYLFLQDSVLKCFIVTKASHSDRYSLVILLYQEGLGSDKCVGILLFEHVRYIWAPPQLSKSFRTIYPRIKCFFPHYVLNRRNTKIKVSLDCSEIIYKRIIVEFDPSLDG